MGKEEEGEEEQEGQQRAEEQPREITEIRVLLQGQHPQQQMKVEEEEDRED